MLTTEQEEMLLDLFAMTKKQAEESIVLDTSRDDDGNEFHVIRDNLAAPGARLLFKIEKNAVTLNVETAQKKLTALRRMRTINAIVAFGRSLEQQDQNFRSAT